MYELRVARMDIEGKYFILIVDMNMMMNPTNIGML